MPTIQVSYKDLCNLIGKSLSLEELEDIILLVKGELEDATPQPDGDYELSIEITSDRPDMLSAEGLARTIKGFLEIELGIPKYEVAPPKIVARVDRSVLPVRPCVAFAIVRGIKFNDYLIRQIMQLQEKLHETYGRKRRKVSIGIHDLDKVNPPFKYFAEDPDKIRFVPLGETKEMSGREILEKHPKGVTYGHIIKDFNRYPLIIDRDGNVLSMPPIINSIVTQVTEQTRNLFIDVTGTEWDAVLYALNIIVTNLAERGGKIEAVRVEHPERSFVSPDLSLKTMNVNIDFINKILGYQLDAPQIIRCLKKCRLDAELVSENEIRVYIPAYRTDFLHPVDIAEEVAIGFGYNRIEPETPPTLTFGKELDDAKFCRKIRDIMVGMGFQEVYFYVMSSEDIQVHKMNLPRLELVTILNPTSQEFTVLRRWLLPGLLLILSRNSHVPLPHKIFEVGDVVEIDESLENKTRNVKHVAAVISDHSTSYEDIQAVVYALLRSLGIEFKVQASEHPSFINGRCATILIGGKEAGIMGEVNPEVLMNFGIENPTTAFELDIDALLAYWKANKK